MLERLDHVQAEGVALIHLVNHHLHNRRALALKVRSEQQVQMIQGPKASSVRLHDDQHHIGNAQRLMEIDVITRGRIDDHRVPLAEPQASKTLRQPTGLLLEPALEAFLLLDIDIAEGHHLATGKAQLLQGRPLPMLQTGAADAGQGGTDPKVMMQGILRVQVQRHHRLAQALQPTAQGRDQSAAAHTAIDRHQRHYFRAQLRGIDGLLVDTFVRNTAEKVHSCIDAVGIMGNVFAKQRQNFFA